MRSIYINKEGIVCYMECPIHPKDMIPAEEFSPYVSSYAAPYLKEYEQSLTAAKQSAVPFEKSTRDQYLTKLSLLNAKSINPITDQDVFRLFDKHFQKDTIHPFPEDQYDVEVKRIKVGTEVVDGFTGNYMMIYKDVAVLIPVKSEQKENIEVKFKRGKESEITLYTRNLLASAYNIIGVIEGKQWERLPSKTWDLKFAHDELKKRYDAIDRHRAAFDQAVATGKGQEYIDNIKSEEKSEQKDIDVTQLKEEELWKLAMHQSGNQIDPIKFLSKHYTIQLKEGESQDEIWSEAQDFIKNNLGTYSNDLVCDMARWAIEALKKHYTITRKQ